MNDERRTEASHDSYAALRNPNFRRLLIGNILASIGTQMQSVTVGWELYERTRQAEALGFVGLVEFLPVLLLSLPAGHAADRYSRKKILLLAQAVMALASFGLALLSYYQGPIPLIYVCLLFVGISQSINWPARWALLPQLVPEAELSNAVTWNSSGWQIAAMAGPALGGLVIKTRGALTAYVLTCVLVLAVIGLLIPIRPRPVSRVSERLSLRSLVAGIKFVFQAKPILATITLDLFAVLLGGATALLPIYAKDILNVGPTGLGWLRAAPALGAFPTAMLLAHRPPLRRSGLVLFWCVTGFGLATVIFGLSTNFMLSMAMLFLTGAFDNVSVVIRGTLVQVLTPDTMRGRVSAVNAIFISSSNQLGDFESGMTAQWFGPVASVVAGGIGTIVVVVCVMWRWPETLRLGSLHKIEPIALPETETA
jgi:MFS family permease